MKAEKMKGGIEWPVVSVILVFVGLFVLTITIGFYFRSVLVGEPIEIRTYTEYRWMNYFPSSVLFYLSYPTQSWNILNELAKLGYEETEILTVDEFHTMFSEDEELRGDSNKLKDLLDNLAEKTKKERHTYIIKDKKGLIISMGLPKDKLQGLIVTYPEQYPYNCFYKDMPVFSREVSNMRVKFVYCCGDIKECGDYLSGPGRAECTTDPCKVSKTTGCKIVTCTEEEGIAECESEEVGTRICVEEYSSSITPEPEPEEEPTIMECTEEQEHAKICQHKPEHTEGVYVCMFKFPDGYKWRLWKSCTGEKVCINTPAPHCE